VGRKVVVTPTGQTSVESVGRLREFWQRLGCDVLTMAPAEHDAALAVTSHLPHLVAFALAAATPPALGPLASTGWRDTTRVAAADPTLWQQIFTSNRQAVVAALDRFDGSLSALRQALIEGDDDQLLDLLEQARKTRETIGSASASAKR
jgi:prephenate dehydrogenase